MPTEQFNFEKALKELEDITGWFEAGDADLDQGLAKFERGLELAGQLKKHLAEIENRVEKIKQKFAPAESAAMDPEPATPDDDTPPLGEPPVDDAQAGLF